MKKLTVLAIILLTAACTTSSTSDSGTGTPSGNTPGGGGNGGDNGGGDNTGDGKDTETKTGSIIVTQSSFSVAGNDMFMYSAMASFVDATGSTAGTTNGVKCTQSNEGDCAITECDMPSGGDTGNPDAGTPAEPKKQPSAGDITVSALEEITMSPDGSGAYTAKSGQVALFEGGADISFKAAGAEVPAFEKVLKAPSSVTLTAPAWPAAGTALDIDRSKDLDLTWDNGTAGDVQATISSLAGGKTATVTCKFKADAGQGKIPAGALGKLVVTDTGSISVSAMSSESFDQGGWKLSVMALAPAGAGSSSAAGSAKIK